MEELLKRAAMNLKRAQIAKSGAFDRELASLDLTMALWVVLDRITSNPGQSTHALAKASFMTDQSVGEHIAKLNKRGLITRTAGPGRAIRHNVTDPGRKLLEQANPMMALALRNAFAGLSHAEVEQLVALLEKISPAAKESAGIDGL